MGLAWRAAVRRRMPPCPLWVGCGLSLALHLTVVAACLWLYCFWVAPAGGGGGGGGGNDGCGVLAVDLAGLGAGAGEPCAAADDATAAAGAFSPEAAAAAAASRQETFRNSVPVLTDVKPAPTPEPAPARVKHSRPCLKRPAAKPTHPSQKRTACAAVGKPRPGPPAAGGRIRPGESGHGGGTGGGIGQGHGSGTGSGQGPGQGSGIGGGIGSGRGPGIGPGEGPGGGGGMSLAQVDVKPRISRQVKPDYPAAARRQGIEGRVVARLLITAEGTVTRISIVSARPPAVFDRSVRRALARWRFHPARFRGRAVATWVMLPIRFDLRQ